VVRRQLKVSLEAINLGENMARTAFSEYEPIPADPELLQRLNKSLSELWGQTTQISASYEYEDGGTDIVQIESHTLQTLVPLAPPISLITFRPQDLFGSALSIFVRSDCLIVSASADTMMNAKQTKTVAVMALQLQLKSEGESERVVELERRVDAVQRIQEENIRLRVFLSFRFIEPDTSIAQELERFLSLHGVDVVTGQSYEPRRIEEKVRSRLKGVDCIVYLLTTSGGSVWVRDEIAASLGAGVPVIPIVEEGESFERGLFGDIEWIRFDSGHIGDVWIKLTEALGYLRTGKVKLFDIQ
jgi:hypothetical protein